MDLAQPEQAATWLAQAPSLYQAGLPHRPGPVSTSAMILVTSHEAIMATHRNGHPIPARLGLMAGFAVMMVLDAALEQFFNPFSRRRSWQKPKLHRQPNTPSSPTSRPCAPAPASTSRTAPSPMATGPTAPRLSSC